MGKGLFEKCYESFAPIYKKAFGWSFIFGLVAHLYMLVNKFPLGDDVGFSYYPNAGIGVTSGRWFLELYSKFDWAYNIPSIRGTLALLFLAISFCFVVRVIGLKKESDIILCAFIFITFPYMASIFTQMYMADSYSLGVLFSCIGAYLIIHKNKVNNIAGIFLLTLGLGIYQSVIIYAIILIYFSFFNLLLKKEENKLCDRIKLVIKYAICLVASVVVYYLILQYYLHKYNTTLNSYQGISEMTHFSLGQMVASIGKAYSYFLVFISGGVISNKLLVLNVVLIVAFFYAIFLNARNSKIFELIFQIVMIGLYPIVCGFIFIMAPEAHVYSLQLSQYVLMYIEMIYVIFSIVRPEYEKNYRNIKQLNTAILSFVEIGCILIGFTFVTKTNKLYYELFLTYEASYSYYTQLVCDIKTNENYVNPQSTAIFVSEASDEFWDSAYVPELNDFGWDINREMIINHKSYGSDFARIYLGFDSARLSADQMEEIQFSEQYINMPVWPKEGSIQMIGDFLVVKIGKGE